MIIFICSRNSESCAGCPIKEHCEYIELTEEIDPYSLYEKGRTDQKEEDNKFFNFDAVIEIEKKKSYDQAIDDCKKSIVNTESKVVNPCANKSWETLTLLADRQFEILSILEQLKERK